ncbi:MAG: hypothetical protein IKQ24_03055 [Verrucomicrobia bacterium]|jgi:hypothetical protein|nr:hypothetical protein [Verrucomicrobiota bacterium]
MSKTKMKNILVVVIAITLFPLFTFISGAVLVHFDRNSPSFSKECERKLRSQSGIVFPKDALLIRALDDRLGQHLYYTAKEPFILPENLKRLHSINLKNQDYYLELGDIGNGLSWISDEKPFKLPVDLDELYLQDNKGFASKEALVSRVKELEAKGEEWETHSNLELDEKIFSCYFKTNITGATESLWANWITNGLVFDAQILKNPEKYYMRLWLVRKARPDELETKKEVATQ